ncbi:glycerophosphodiester phosphodiesterase GDPD4 isoform X2 [Benincasa hispida]|uniref:glycerophosphodiester phosphodiesterase GDPD4 isoform X2 n=1 Tax=Benincasa hispida TaxID=102211 RepID=UPI001900B3EE|nr:glycerophosphodiester phosphodiesterase GDPD4 isoform X2 [Benincasa hispida]
MAISISRVGRRRWIGQRPWRNRFPFRFSSRRLFRLTILCLAFIAILPPIYFHFKLKRFQQMQQRKCKWLNHPPLVCAHGGDSSKAFPNTMDAYNKALRSQANCIEVDVSRSSDGVLFALHDRDLQRITGSNTSKVGNFSMKEIKNLGAFYQHIHKLLDFNIPTVEEALVLMAKSVQQVILDAKVGPPSYENGLAKDIISVNQDCQTFQLYDPALPTKVQGKIWCLFKANKDVRDRVVLIESVGWELVSRLCGEGTGNFQVEKTKCKNCLVWAKSDSLARDVIRLSSDIKVGYIVMMDPTTGERTNLLRMKAAKVVGVYHPLIDENLMRILHRRDKNVYAWTVDDSDSMKRMLAEGVDAVVTSNPTLLGSVMQDTRTTCLENGFSLS